ncbi:hypothetical protein BST33_15035 [Mycolicibacter minnesotensis]|uniref:Uncharacterized protein n=1 Tax=Mycolicibacter minnesotensis TaxID=1118379 RepID=A0A7I7R5T3_9MYCO|nr:hypothetical protein [Mycolicibacter minnesotensis]ORA99033.1 hypothetical protein BST33_15035 [Mycolicibacter minnesotensis]BBY33517.1 hypothetical protein MMIN_15780 [Mycolicibacter minnesotensis]
MLNPKVHRLSQPDSDPPGAARMAPGVTAYVVDAPELVAGNHPLFEAIAELGVTAKRFAADAHVLVVVSKAGDAAEPGR